MHASGELFDKDQVFHLVDQCTQNPQNGQVWLLIRSYEATLKVFWPNRSHRYDILLCELQNHVLNLNGRIGEVYNGGQ